MDKIKTVKIKNEDGSISTESYNISADARNIDMTNGYNVQDTIGTINIDNDGSIAEQLNNINDNIDNIEINIKKKAYYFDTVTDMKNANLKLGDYAITLGYYEVNDGGNGEYVVTSNININQHQEKLNNNLYANLLIQNEVNIKQLGAKGDGRTDDSSFIQIALNKYNIVKIPAGDYMINNPLVMRFNTSIYGEGPAITHFLVGSNMGTNYIINYGQEYNYGGKRGILKGFNITGANTGYGIKLYSGIIIDNVTFTTLKVAINRVNNYIDKINLINCGIGYCNGDNELFAINLAGAGDELKIDTLTMQSAYTANNYNEKSGLYISRCNGGYIKNSIINTGVLINRSTSFNIENSHFEGSQGSDYYGNEAYIQIENSCVSIVDCFLHKRVNGGNIIINDSSSHGTSNINLENLVFVINNNNFIPLKNNFINYEIEKSTGSILTIKNLSVFTDFSSSWTNTREKIGIRIKDNSQFNENSSYYSISSIVTCNNKIKTVIPELNDIYSDSNFLLNSASNANIPFYETGLSASDQYIMGIIVFDENRKLAVKKSQIKQVTNITSSDSSGKNGRGILIDIGATNCLDVSGQGLNLWYYRGTASGQYNKITKIPILVGQYLFDFGNYVSGCQTETRTVGDIDTFNYVKKCSKNGDNVIFYASALPTTGSFIKGDRCINSNITTGNVKSWIYNGTNWISEGTY